MKTRTQRIWVWYNPDSDSDYVQISFSRHGYPRTYICKREAELLFGALPKLNSGFEVVAAIKRTGRYAKKESVRYD